MVTATCVVCARQAHAWATFTLCSMVLLQHCLSPLLLLQLDLNITWQSCKHFLHIVLCSGRVARGNPQLHL